MKKSVPVELIPLIEWWEKDGKSTVLGGVLALLVVGGYFGFTHLRAARKASASEALLAATTVEELQESSSAYEGSAAGPALKMRLASALYNKGDYEAALAIYEELKDNPPEGFADVPAVGRAACLEALGRPDEALEAYQAFAESKPKSFLSLTARLGVVRTLAAKGKKAEALERLDALDKEFVADPVARIRLLETRDLVKRGVTFATAQKKDAVTDVLKTLESEKK